jgi:hypothetical protein
MTARGGALLHRRDPGINGFPFHQHLFNFTPLLKQKLVLGQVSRTLPRKDAPDREVIFMFMVGHSSRNVAATGAELEGERNELTISQPAAPHRADQTARVGTRADKIACPESNTAVPFESPWLCPLCRRDCGTECGRRRPTCATELTLTLAPCSSSRLRAKFSAWTGYCTCMALRPR